MQTAEATPSRGQKQENGNKVKAEERYQDPLDKALDDTFPASDPLAITTPHPDEKRPDRRKGKRP